LHISMANQVYQFRLKITGPNGSQIFDLPQASVIGGRQAGNPLLLNDPLVSRQHVRFECSAQECQITDLGSANGTYCNGEKLVPNVAYPILPGAQIKIGPFELTLEAEMREIPRAEASIIEMIVAAPKEDVSPQIDQASEDMPDKPPQNPVEEAPVIQMRVDNLPIDRFEQLPPSGPPGSPPGEGEQVEGGELQPIPGLSEQSTRLINYLPGIYQTDFMARFLGIFESILTPLEWTIDSFDLFLSPKTAPEKFLPWLQNWYGVIFHPSWTEEKRRQFLADAHMIYACRGTRKSLARILEIYTGLMPQIIDKGNDLEPHTFKVRLPAKRGQFQEDVLQELIDGNKPAHTTYSIEYIG